MNDQNNLNNQGNNNFASPLQPPSQMPQEPVNQQQSFIQNPVVDNNTALAATPSQNIMQPQVMPQPNVQPQVMPGQVQPVTPPLVEQQPMNQNMNGYNYQYPQNNYEQQTQNFGGYQDPVNQSTPKKSNKKLIIILLIVLVGLPLIGFVVMIASSTLSVNNYIDNSRKSAYVDTALQYIKASHTYVLREQVPHPDDDTLILVPAGHDINNSMLLLESGGASPYDSTYLYAYVLIEKNDGEEIYHFVASDAKMYGITFVAEKELTERNSDDYVHAGMNLETTGIGKCHKTLEEKYGNSKVEKGNISKIKECTDKMNLQNKSIKKYIICSNKGCE